MASTVQLIPSRVGPPGPDPATRVYWKLGMFSVAMFAAPLTAYYLSRERLFDGNPTYAGGLAAFVANVVLVGYVIAAFLEDQGDGQSQGVAKRAGWQEQSNGPAGIPSEAKKDK